MACQVWRHHRFLVVVLCQASVLCLLPSLTHLLLLCVFVCAVCMCLRMLPALPLCRFEGITRQDVPHGMGVMVFGNGTGGGFHFRDVRLGDT